MNIQWSKQPPYTWSCLWNLILWYFCYFEKDKFLLTLNLFSFLISRPNSSMERDERGFLNKALDWKIVLLHLKFKQKPGCPNKKYNAIFEYIHRNIRAYPRNKKNLHWSMDGKLLLHIGKNQRKHGQVWFVPNAVQSSGRECNPRKILCFLPSFKIGNNIFSTKTDTKLLHKYEHLFFLNTVNLIINSDPFFHI